MLSPRMKRSRATGGNQSRGSLHLASPHKVSQRKREEEVYRGGRTARSVRRPESDVDLEEGRRPGVVRRQEDERRDVREPRLDAIAEKLSGEENFWEPANAMQKTMGRLQREEEGGTALKPKFYCKGGDGPLKGTRARKRVHGEGEGRKIPSR